MKIRGVPIRDLLLSPFRAPFWALEAMDQKSFAEALNSQLVGMRYEIQVAMDETDRTRRLMGDIERERDEVRAKLDRADSRIRSLEERHEKVSGQRDDAIRRSNRLNDSINEFLDWVRTHEDPVVIHEATFRFKQAQHEMEV